MYIYIAFDRNWVKKSHISKRLQMVRYKNADQVHQGQAYFYFAVLFTEINCKYVGERA